MRNAMAIFSVEDINIMLKTDLVFILRDLYAKQLMGYMALNLNNNGKKCNIDTILIKEEYQGKGYGKAFLELAILVTKICNIPFITLEVLNTNTKAIDLYKKYSFQITKYHKDRLIMELHSFK